MDMFITLTIVAVALLWAAARLLAQFKARGQATCGSCTGCPAVTASRCSSPSRQSELKEHGQATAISGVGGK